MAGNKVIGAVTLANPMIQKKKWKFNNNIMINIQLNTRRKLIF